MIAVAEPKMTKCEATIVSDILNVVFFLISLVNIKAGGKKYLNIYCPEGFFSLSCLLLSFLLLIKKSVMRAI